MNEVFMQQQGSSSGHIISLRAAVGTQEQYRASHIILPKIEQLFLDATNKISFQAPLVIQDNMTPLGTML